MALHACAVVALELAPKVDVIGTIHFHTLC
jgi:hypothetical protein